MNIQSHTLIKDTYESCDGRTTEMCACSKFSLARMRMCRFAIQTLQDLGYHGGYFLRMRMTPTTSPLLAGYMGFNVRKRMMQ